MVDFEQLKARSLRAYEIARLRVALRIAYALAPLAAICAVFSRNRKACVCIFVVLLGAAVWLRWRDRRGADDVRVGVVAGLVPLSVGLLLSAAQLECGGPLCLALSALAGGAAGTWIARQERSASSPLASLLTAASIAALAASMGCLPLGLFGVGGAAAGICVGTGIGALAGSTR